MAATSNNNNGESLLLEDLMFEILLWVPVVSLLRFKSVCRSWLSLIEGPRFISQYNYNANRTEEENYNKLIILQQGQKFTINCKLLSSSSGKVNDNDTDSNKKVFQEQQFDITFDEDDILIFQKVLIIWDRGSNCNWDVCLWNPATKQFRILPTSRVPLPPLPTPYSYSVDIGFGFDLKTNDFKVSLRHTTLNHHKWEDCYH
ncbi:hypothetical protein AQUCO_00700325v1 [Aquilegia coerulea]|uniref:F-box domain-containing protein n=1 Tax=Aquilegia coerulea TaxID=218851 RepID=A0A2G5EJJ6_AQUCA|nr:hypothetical protein AQUCO_00700325v1 [Aquilegia coerulea]